jgi:hypothetical protein
MLFSTNRVRESLFQERSNGFSFLSITNWLQCVCERGGGSLLNGKSILVDRGTFKMLFSHPSVNYKTMCEREGVNDSVSNS